MAINTLFTIAGCAVALGLAIVLWGWRGRRVNDHPSCRACGYDLSGLSAAEICPECGRALNARRAIRSGMRIRRRWAVVVGLAVALSSGIPLWLALSQVKWIRHAPVWVLREIADGTKSQIAAINEARRRVNTGGLDPDDARTLAEIGLKLQGDPKATWLCEWGDFIEDAWAGQLLTKEQMQQYLRQSTVEGFKFVHRPQVVQGSKITMRVETPRCRTGNGIDQNMYVLVWKCESFGLDDKFTQTKWGAVSPRMAFYTAYPMRGSGPHIAADVAPGRHSLKVRFRVGVIETANRNGHVEVLRVMGWPKNTMIEWQEELASEIEVLPPDSALIEVVTDDSMLDDFQANIDLEELSIQLHTSGNRSDFRGRIHLPTPPMDMAWRCWLEVGERRWPIAQQCLSAGQGFAMLHLYNSEIITAGDLPSDVTTGRIIMQADATLAEECIDIGNRILGGEIVLGNVPIKQTAD